MYFDCKHTHTHTQIAKHSKEEKRKRNETKEDMEKENVVAVNSIGGKYNVIRYHLPICSVSF